MNPNKKWLDLGLALVAFVLFLILRQALGVFWTFFKFPVQESWPVSIVDILSFVIALATFIILKRNAQVNSFGLEVISELGKVTWPTQKETVASTGVILVMVAIASGILFVFDTVWSMLTRLFLEL